MAALVSSMIPQPLNVVDFGAVGDGTIDDSKAFMNAWEAVCRATQETTLIIPARKTFLLNPVKFLGPCKSPSIKILVQGNIVAPSKMSDWTTPYMGSWIVFARVNGLNVIGNGQIDGQGFEWWKCAMSSKCMRPMGMKIHTCNNIQISGLKIFNSPARFLSVSDSNHVTISNLQITNPETSPNTDGMDLTHSTNIHIRDCQISTGDDCIAILSGCSYIFISGVSCIQGHGISIGSLGHNRQRDTVEEVHVRNCKFGSSLNGAHIKTWQGGSGFVRKVSFQDITLLNTSNPINIDQFYCPHNKCANQTKAVKVSDISFLRFSGTSFTETAINIACSESLGCFDIVMDQINIISSDANKKVDSKCFNAHGRSTNTVPRVDCLSY
ncbi:probable polygalacturonase At3g15720 [Hevea brasiliensis]|uniref:probable polygalacturonase At3g15720 n=1 Tax=Hevea brasiliensis TaxID=3981 RepID=UPI0025D08089|nr:probable polygalacturonase At3g15720 [Hevea brasiliensis]XP_058005122.1 probable polygalacturonase At3g15720 [Hevea brasiliensis]